MNTGLRNKAYAVPAAAPPGPDFTDGPLTEAAAMPAASVQRLVGLAARLSHTLALGRALLQGGRRVDLTGIDDGVGVLCAQALDLGHDDALVVVPALREVLAQLELLAASLKASSPPTGALT